MKKLRIMYKNTRVIVVEPSVCSSHQGVQNKDTTLDPNLSALAKTMTTTAERQLNNAFHPEPSVDGNSNIDKENLRTISCG